MGCCLSSQRSRSSAPTAISTSQNHVAADSSRANINNPTPLPQPHSTQSFLSASTSDSPSDTPRPSHSRNDGSAVVDASGRGRRRGSQQPPSRDTRPNKPLVPIDRGRRCKGPVLEGGATPSPSPRKAGAAAGSLGSGGYAGTQLTRERLEKERDAFWDTRVTGHEEIWGAVRLAAELVRGGDVVSAQGVLDAAGATCPTGEIWRGVFDEWGSEYRFPEWVVMEPVGVVEVEETEEEEGAEGEDGEGVVDGAEQGLAEEKGKGKMGEIVKVRARLSDRGTDVVVKVGMEERVNALIAKIMEAAKLPPTNRIRIAYLGRIFRENDSLAAQGYSQGHVVNALVF